MQTANKELNKYIMVLCRQLCFLDMFYAQDVDVIFLSLLRYATRALIRAVIISRDKHIGQLHSDLWDACQGTLH